MECAGCRLPGPEEMGFRFVKYFLFAVAAFGLWSLIAAALGNYLIVSRPLDGADAIIVLAGGREYEERALEAARLFRQGVSTKIVLTNDGVEAGWDDVARRNLLFVERARSLLLANGVPEESIEIVPGVIRDGSEVGTVVEANAVSSFCKDQGYTRIMLVTSAYHTRRALKVYTGIPKPNSPFDAVGISHPPLSKDEISYTFWWLSLKKWRVVPGEYLKILVST